MDGGAPCQADDDCDHLDSECSEGFCNPTTSHCEALPANESAPCGAGTTCGTPDECVYPDSCAEQGVQDVPCTFRSCQAGACVASEGTLTQGCNRDTDGTTCDVTTCNGYGACTGSDTCDTTGAQTRDCTDHVCAAAACTPVTRQESRNCTRVTNGLECAPTECTAFGGCLYDGDPSCDATGTQERTCIDFACQNGACEDTLRIDAQVCYRPGVGEDGTEGWPCGQLQCGAYGACTFEGDVCDESGLQTRSCVQPTCWSEMCWNDPVADPAPLACSRDTDNASCGTSYCDPWGACAYDGDPACDESGTQTRWCYAQLCGGGACQQTSWQESQACTRVTAGSDCGTTCGNWSACAYDGNPTCDETGSQNRTCTARTCGGGTCNSSTYNENRNCTRNTDGNTCGNPVECGNTQTFREQCCQSGSCVLCGPCQ
ncbi:MAG: hypothetical protein AB2A00_36285 [Myxococcota bacterium]